MNAELVLMLAGLIAGVVLFVAELLIHSWQRQKDHELIQQLNNSGMKPEDIRQLVVGTVPISAIDTFGRLAATIDQISNLLQKSYPDALKLPAPPPPLPDEKKESL